MIYKWKQHRLSFKGVTLFFKSLNRTKSRALQIAKKHRCNVYVNWDKSHTVSYMVNNQDYILETHLF